MQNMTALQVLKQSVQSITWLMGISSVLMGTAAAMLHGNFEPIVFSLCIVFVVFAHSSSAFYHRYTDEKYSFGENIDKDIAPFTESGLHTQFVFREVTIASALITATIGVSIAAMAGWQVLFIGIVLCALIMVTVGGSSPLMRRPWVIFVTFVIFGPIGVITSCLVQSQHYTFTDIFNWYDLGPAVFLSVASGLMAVNCHLIVNYMDAANDTRNSKNSFTVKFGKRTTRVTYFICALLMAAVMVAVYYFYRPTDWGLTIYAPLLSLPFYGYVCYKIKNAKSDKEFLKLEYITFYLYFAIALVTLLLFAFVGAPMDSRYQYL